MPTRTVAMSAIINQSLGFTADGNVPVPAEIPVLARHRYPLPHFPHLQVGWAFKVVIEIFLSLRDIGTLSLSFHTYKLAGVSR